MSRPKLNRSTNHRSLNVIKSVNMLSILFNIETIQKFIQSGFDVNFPNQFGLTLIFFTFNIDIMYYLIKSGANLNIRNMFGQNVLYFRNYQISKILIENGINLNNVDINGNTALHFARTVEVAKLLIDNGADVNKANKANITPLMYHIISNVLYYEPVINYMLSVGATLTEEQARMIS